MGPTGGQELRPHWGGQMRRAPFAVHGLGALVFQVIGQQISVVAATAIFARVVERFGGRAPDPDDLAALDPETLRGLGLSRQRANTVLDLAERFRTGRLSEAELRNLPDDEAIRQVKGGANVRRRRRCRHALQEIVSFS